MDIVVERHGGPHKDVDRESSDDVGLPRYDVSSMVSLGTNRRHELGAVD